MLDKSSCLKSNLFLQTRKQGYFQDINSEYQQPNHYNKQMSTQGQTVSQITLLKVASNTAKCEVFCKVNQSLHKYQLAVDGSTSVQNIIHECMSLINKNLKAAGNYIQLGSCQLYASKRNGKKINDLPGLERQQKVLKIGVKSFYLQFGWKIEKKGTNMCSLSTKSIQSEMKVEKKMPKQTKAFKQFGCFCFAG